VVFEASLVELIGSLCQFGAILIGQLRQLVFFQIEIPIKIPIEILIEIPI